MKIISMGSIPCTHEQKKEVADEAYEPNTRNVIVNCLKERGIDPLAISGIIAKDHGSFGWSKDSATSVYYAVVMEAVAEMDLKTLALNPQVSIVQYVLDNHYMHN